MTKKGISPLIATVLIIGLTVSLATTVIIWGKGVYEERKVKEGAIADIKFDCSTGIDFEILDVYYESNVLIAQIENLGDQDIDGFRVRILGNLGKYDVNQSEQLLETNRVMNIEIGFDLATVGLPVEAEYYPMFDVGKDTFVVCEKSSIVANVVPKST